jgi:hypothetical protein
MKSIFAKITLFAVLGLGSIGTVFAWPQCPTAAGTIIYAEKIGEAWGAFRFPPTANSSIWESLLVIINDKDVTTQEAAIKRGQEILDSSWWGASEASMYQDSKTNGIFFRCEYGVANQFANLKDRVVLMSVTYGGSQATNMLTSVNSPTSRGGIKNIMDKANKR